ncbi:terminase small subunit-like protein [Sphingopyxis macrogoltabida]|uniref:Terminase small subunit n=2 Tax=Sphingopyxis macrogoltabida TaxID=33050 RepID=A0AAC9FGK1_SPHMC|nr:hypothetical protein LH19_20940 [Sphingopyxis macrogoltabida]AMU91598.1 hypothetical protein ATM17_21520 [Sphingopyxis macrogoltabida]
MASPPKPKKAAPRAKRATKALDREKAIPVILAGVAAGKALDVVLKEDPTLPSPSTFWRWHMDDVKLRDNLARAREMGVEVHMDEALSIADTPMQGQIVTRKLDKDGNEYDEVRTEDMLGHRKLMIETRIKRAQMIAPRKYGPKLDVTSDGERIEMESTDVAVRLASIFAGIEKRRAGDGDDDAAG